MPNVGNDRASPRGDVNYLNVLAPWRAKRHAPSAASLGQLIIDFDYSRTVCHPSMPQGDFVQRVAPIDGSTLGPN